MDRDGRLAEAWRDEHARRPRALTQERRLPTERRRLESLLAGAFPDGLPATAPPHLPRRAMTTVEEQRLPEQAPADPAVRPALRSAPVPAQQVRIVRTAPDRAATAPAPEHRTPADHGTTALPATTPDDPRDVYRRDHVSPEMVRALDAFWDRHEQRLAGRRQNSLAAPDAKEQVDPSALAQLPDDLARTVVAEGGDREALDRAEKVAAVRPVPVVVEGGVFKGNAARHEKGRDEAVIDEANPGALQGQVSGTAWLGQSGIQGGELQDQPGLRGVRVRRDVTRNIHQQSDPRVEVNTGGGEGALGL